MLNILNFEALRKRLLESWYISLAVMMALVGLTPVVFKGGASAQSLSSRSVTITTSQPSATGVSYDFDFTMSTAGGTVQSLILQFCTTPLGTCTLPTGMDIDESTASLSAGQTWTNATDFADYAGADAGGCTDADGGSGTSTMLCGTRTEAGNEDADAKSVTVSGVTNPSIPSGNTTSVYIRISLYSDTAFATAVDDGTVAASIVEQLTVTGRVQERLVFCTFALNDAGGSNSTVGTADGEFPTSCAATEANESSNVDIGVIDNLSVTRSPVDNSPPSSLGNDRFGAAMVNTNASNGVVVSYYSTTASSGTEQLKAFRVPGATCDATNTTLTDQCFYSADEDAGETVTIGNEMFGMQLVCVANSNTIGAGTTSNLGTGGNGSGSAGTFNTVYANGDTTLSGLQDNVTDNCENDAGEGDLVGWNDDTAAQPLISSTSVVDDELLKMSFVSSANATTPTGTYTVSSTFIATATF